MNMLHAPDGFSSSGMTKEKFPPFFALWVKNQTNKTNMLSQNCQVGAVFIKLWIVLIAHVRNIKILTWLRSFLFIPGSFFYIWFSFPCAQVSSRLVPSRYLSVFWGERRLGSRLRHVRVTCGFPSSLPMRPRARFNLLPNLLSPQKNT